MHSENRFRKIFESNSCEFFAQSTHVFWPKRELNKFGRRVQNRLQLWTLSNVFARDRQIIYELNLHLQVNHHDGSAWS